LALTLFKDKLFRHIILARLAYPVSKLKTTFYLRRYQGEEVDVNAIYRFLDKLRDKHKEEVEKIVYEYTKDTLGTISVVFYDMTTLYFEAENEDDLRKIGCSKDGKFQKPQIMLGLLVGQNGYPISYDIFEGNTFEGYTLIPILEEVKKKYGFKKITVIADAALLSKKNLENLSQEEYKYIIGARIKNESQEIKEEILKKAKGMSNGEGFTVKKDNIRLIVTYSKKRAKKDKHNREKGVKSLRKRVESGKLTKKSINNRGYNKFLTLKGNVSIQIDENKVEEDKKWDGLKGYITNTGLAPKTVADNYKHLWQIEKAFRISKTDLRIRPIYHYRRRRIEAHICIAFVAYTIYKELERLLYKHNTNLSSKKAAELTHTMYQLEYMLPHSRKKQKKLLKMDKEQLELYNAIHIN